MLLDFNRAEGDRLTLIGSFYPYPAPAVYTSPDDEALPLRWMGAVPTGVATLAPGLALPMGATQGYVPVYWVPQIGGDGWVALDLDRDGILDATDFAVFVNTADNQPLTAADFPGDGFNIELATASGDSILGTAVRDSLNGLAGNDTISGLDGADTLQGGTGNDSLLGNEGNDILDGGEGADTLAAGSGDDSLFGLVGTDYLDGGNGNDLLDGGEGDDTLLGGDGNDTLLGGVGDNLSGGAGDDVILMGTTTLADIHALFGA